MWKHLHISMQRSRIFLKWFTINFETHKYKICDTWVYNNVFDMDSRSSNRMVSWRKWLRRGFLFVSLQILVLCHQCVFHIVYVLPQQCRNIFLIVKTERKRLLLYEIWTALTVVSLKFSRQQLYAKLCFRTMSLILEPT